MCRTCEGHNLGRFSKKMMDQCYSQVSNEIREKTQDSDEMDRLTHEYLEYLYSDEGQELAAKHFSVQETKPSCHDIPIAANRWNYLCWMKLRAVGRKHKESISPTGEFSTKSITPTILPNHCFNLCYESTTISLKPSATPRLCG